MKPHKIDRLEYLTVAGKPSEPLVFFLLSCTYGYSLPPSFFIPYRHRQCRCPLPPSPRIRCALRVAGSLLRRRRWTGCTDRNGQRRWHGSPSLVSTHTCPTPIHIPAHTHTRSDTDTIPDTACPFLGSCTCTAARGSGRRRRYSEAAAGAGRQPTPAARCSKAAREANKTVPVPYCHAASLPCHWALAALPCRRPALPSAPVKRGAASADICCAQMPWSSSSCL